MGAACRAENANPSGAPDFTSGFHRGSCCPVICVALFYVSSVPIQLELPLSVLENVLILTCSISV